jgi:phosphate transport system permease protein
VRERWHERRELEVHETGAVNARLERERLAQRDIELAQGVGSNDYAEGRARLAAVERAAEDEQARIRGATDVLDRENARYGLSLVTADGTEKTLRLDEIVRIVPANRLGLFGRVGVYLSRWKEFLLDEPREANSEGGVFPAIFGTVAMTLLMTLLVVPIGVLAALYLREYARAGWIVSSVRIAINNLAGVPSIVFGVFGLGFFCYLVGGSIDRVLFEAKLPSPTFGTGGILWASLTLALLTLPVVIVATEEALAAVPNSMREGSFACGASKWQTIRRIVLPRAMPGIITGTILAMARGAGEVAPLMLVGAVKLAPELPLDGTFPFVHPERSFMHLGFHIYDLGFQSQNSEAAKPMVFTTTLLLIAIVVALNLTAVTVRARLHRGFKGSHI